LVDPNGVLYNMSFVEIKETILKLSREKRIPEDYQYEDVVTIGELKAKKITAQ
jgi:hypothetical protein